MKSPEFTLIQSPQVNISAILLKFKKCPCVCLCANSSAVYGPTGAKLGREVGGRHKKFIQCGIRCALDQTVSSVCTHESQGGKPHCQGASIYKSQDHHGHLEK